jgi:hypothetical protein
MFEVVNRTPFVVTLVPGLGKDDVANMTVVAKATFQIDPRSKELAVAEEQVPFLAGDEWNGPEPADSSVRYESDASPAKPGTDVILVGHAHAGARPQRVLEVEMRVGPIHKRVLVTGDRRWVKAGPSWVASAPPVPFERVPLIYERAYGGVDRSDPERARQAREERNPVGTGFAASSRTERLDGLALPNLEDPRRPIKEWSDRPSVAGFGVIGRDWLPRRAYGGTYDQAWTDQRSPLLPLDFDERFFNAAPADQVVKPHLRGGEPVSLANCSADGPLTFALPRLTLAMSVDWAGGPRGQDIPPLLDTVLLDPDERRVVINWRSTFPCGRKLRQIQRVAVRMAGRV